LKYSGVISYKLGGFFFETTPELNNFIASALKIKEMN